MFPKKIHYCWFGNGQKSQLMEDCIDSWKKHFPDYEIIEWNEQNFDVFQNDYCREAYENKKWAFVSDYARLKIIYEEGGIYFDTDVEVIKNFSSLIEEYGYLCFESPYDGELNKNVATGLGFAAIEGSKVIKEMLLDYDDIHFVNNGEMDLTPCPIRNTKALIRLGLVPDGNVQLINDIKIYSSEYFCGYDLINWHPSISTNTYTVHHYAATWKKDDLKVRLKIKTIHLLQKVLGYRLYDSLKSQIFKG